MSAPGSFERDGLPPPDYFDGDWRTDRLETPVDDRGIVDGQKLLHLLLATFPENTAFQSDKLNAHHLYFYKRWYSHSDNPEDFSESRFRNLPINLWLMPLPLHQQLHHRFTPPPKPKADTMLYTMESFEIAKSLFGKTRGKFKYPRMKRRHLIEKGLGPNASEIKDLDKIEFELMSESLQNLFPDWEEYARRAEKVPRQFRLIEINDPSEPLRNLTTRLGKLVVPQAVKIVPELAAAIY